jgi:hypothetical protein
MEGVEFTAEDSPTEFKAFAGILSVFISFAPLSHNALINALIDNFICILSLNRQKVLVFGNNKSYKRSQ